jgi:hypothetical protein
MQKTKSFLKTIFISSLTVSLLAGYPSQPETFTSTSSPLFVTPPVLAEGEQNETENNQETLKKLWEKEVFKNFNNFDTAYQENIQPYLNNVVNNNGNPPQNGEIFNLQLLKTFRESYNKLLELETDTGDASIKIPKLEEDPGNPKIKLPIIKREYQKILTPETQNKIQQIETYLKNSEKVLYDLEVAFDASNKKTEKQREKLIEKVQRLVGNKEDKQNLGHNEITGDYLDTSNTNVKKYLNNPDTPKGQLLELKELINSINKSISNGSAFQKTQTQYIDDWRKNFLNNPTIWIVAPLVVLIVWILLSSLKSLQTSEQSNSSSSSENPGSRSQVGRDGTSIFTNFSNLLPSFSNLLPSGFTNENARTGELSSTEKAQIFVYVDYILKSRGLQPPVSGNNQAPQIETKQIENIVQKYLNDNWTDIIDSVVKADSKQVGQPVREINPPKVRQPDYYNPGFQNQPDDLIHSFEKPTSTGGSPSWKIQSDQPSSTVPSGSFNPQKLQTWIDFYNERNNQDEVTRAFSQEALELEETPESYNQRRNTTNNQIELEVVGKNVGSFWLLQQDNRGWLFPKVQGITQGNWAVVQNFFQVQVENQSYSYIKVIKPALLATSDQHLWTLVTLGQIVLK